MKVLIVNTNCNAFPVPVLPVGACMVADSARLAGHNTFFLDLMFQKNAGKTIRKEVERFKPDVIGLSIRNIDNNDCENPVFFLKGLEPLIKAIRRCPTAVLVIGGAAVSVMTEELLRFTGASWAVTGEGEIAFPLLLDSISEGKKPDDVPGVAWLEDGRLMKSRSTVGAAHAYQYRMPDMERMIRLKAYRSRMTTIPVQTKLGCHFKCVYCTYRKIEGSAYRLGDPGQTVEIVKRLSANNLKDIEFVDNVFNYPYNHAMAICEGIARAQTGARLQSLEMNPLFIDDALVDAMSDAGFTGIGITVESACDSVLSGLRKGFSSQDVYRAARVIERHKLPCVWIFMFGGPGETRDTVKETLSFAKKFIRRSDIAFFGIGIRIYPGTELESIARKEGVLSLPAHEMLSPVFYISPGVDYQWMKEEIRKAANANMNFIHSDSLSLPFLPALHRFAHGIGVRPPLWKYTRFIRRGLRFVGMDA